MSTTATDHAPGGSPGMRLDVSGTPPVPFGRIVGVELRKMADTRAGIWLLAAIVLITAAFTTIFFIVADSDERTFINFLGFTAAPQGFLLPVLGILLVTSEWGQRTTLTTFALLPSRPRVVFAKAVAALAFGLAAIVLAFIAAGAAAALGGADDAFANIGLEDFGKFGLLQILGILQGLAFGLLLLNSAAAISAYFVLPIASSILVNVVPALRDAAPWIDQGTAQDPMIGDQALTGEEWAQVGVTALLWIALPLVLGLIRVLRSEIK